MKLLTISLFTAAAFSLPAAAPVPAPDPLPAASWAPRDTADSLWRRARIAIADESWREAARTFERLVLNHPSSAYAGDALYWQAFALQRFGGTNELRDAVRALERQKEDYPKSATYTSGESAALMTRLNGRLARGGDSDAAMAIAEIAASAATLGATVAAEVMPAVSAELSRVMPEVQAEVAREMAAASREMSAATREVGESTRAMVRESSARARRSGRGSDIPPGCEDVVTDERIEALNALLQMNADQALPILKRVLERRDRCSEVLRRKAVFLVSQKRSDEAVDILVNTARNDPDATTRSEAVFWLSQTRSERAVEVLEEILVKGAPDEEVQKRAVFALSQTRSPRASEILRDFVVRQDVSTELRGEAIFWLGQMRGDNSRFLRELFPRLESDVLRDKVLFSVAQQKTPENASWLLQRAKDRRLSPELRKQALFWGGQAGASAKDLGEIYDNSPDDSELRGQVIFALSQRRNDSASVDKLFAIAQREKDPELRRQAIFWLGQTKDPRAAQLLDDIINKPF